MANPDEVPSADFLQEDSWLSPDKKREEALNKVCEIFLENYCSIKFNADFVNDELEIDYVQLYASDVVTMGLLYMEFCNAIQEGDGMRIFRCYRYFLPLFRFSQRNNYSNEVLLMLYNLECVSPRLVQQLTWCRTINTSRLPGHNIPCDFYLEHLNRLCKDMIHGMGANKTERSIHRIGKSIGPIKVILDSFDENNDVSRGSGAHSIAERKRDQAAIIKQLMESKIFHFHGNRSHKSFKAFKSPITKEINKDDLKKWMIDRLKKFTLINSYKQ